MLDLVVLFVTPETSAKEAQTLVVTSVLKKSAQTSRGSWPRPPPPAEHLETWPQISAWLGDPKLEASGLFVLGLFAFLSSGLSGLGSLDVVSQPSVTAACFNKGSLECSPDIDGFSLPVW